VKFSNFDRFCSQNLYKKIVCELVQLLRDFVSQLPYQGFAPGPLWGLPSDFRPPVTLVYSYPQMKFRGAVTGQKPIKVGRLLQPNEQTNRTQQTRCPTVLLYFKCVGWHLLLNSNKDFVHCQWRGFWPPITPVGTTLLIRTS